MVGGRRARMLVEMGQGWKEEERLQAKLSRRGLRQGGGGDMPRVPNKKNL